MDAISRNSKQMQITCARVLRPDIGQWPFQTKKILLQIHELKKFILLINKKCVRRDGEPSPSTGSVGSS
jgi:hypothetical protein